MRIIKEENNEALELALKFLREGKLIAFATDTIYGIGADAANYKAVEQLYNIKKRQENKPIAIFVADLEMAEEIFIFDDISLKIAKKFLPGPLTLVLPQQKHSTIKLAPNLNNNADDFLGFRLVDKKFIQDLLNKFGGALAVTSANISKGAAAITAEEVADYFSAENILVIDGKITKHKIASTVLKISNNKAEILRYGAINEHELLDIIDENY